MVRSNVRGPNSALTEFLRSRGIRIQNTRGQQSPTPDGAGNASIDEAPEDGPTSAAVSEQEALDAAVAEELSAVLENEKPKRKSRAGPSKKRKKGEEDEVVDPENEPDYGRSGFTRKNRPTPGQIDFCAKCNCRFTVTIYNKAAEDGGMLCSTCGSADIPGKATPRPRPKPATKKRKAKAVLDGEADKVPKLQDLTIKCIARHIEDVEILGDIGHVNMDKICQIISRNRSLTNDTVQLFLDSSLRSLTLYDCAKINHQRLTQVAQMCPHLTDLRLHMVGQITDTVLLFYANHLQHLKSLALRGCFLITVQGWAKFFEIMGPRLEALEISDTSRFMADTAKALVDHCPNLRHLVLARLTHLDDAAVSHLASLQHLERLDINHAGALVTDTAIKTVLSSIGGNLESLDLSALKELTDVSLLEGVGTYCRKLQHLHLNDIDLLTNDGVAQFFSSWNTNPALLTLSIERCPLLADSALAAVLMHSGSNLRTLVLNSHDELTHDGVLKVAAPNALPLCEVLDISWIRSVDDLVLNRLLLNAKALKKVLVWGNNRITETVTSESCVIVGRETG